MSVCYANNQSEYAYMERKVVPISSKGQITIPKKFITDLQLGREVEIIVDNGTMIIKPQVKESTSEFSALILRDLISQGFQGEELISEFEKQSENVKNAAQLMLADAHEYAKLSKQSSDNKFDDLFETEE